MWQIDTQDERAVVGRYGSLGVAVLHGALDEEFFDRLGGTLMKLTADHPDGFSALVVRASKVPGSMSPPLRRKARDVLTRHGKLRGFAYVLAGTGIKAGLVRAAMNTALKATPVSAKIFSDHSAALQWLSQLPGQPQDLASARAEVLATLEILM